MTKRNNSEHEGSLEKQEDPSMLSPEYPVPFGVEPAVPSDINVGSAERLGHRLAVAAPIVRVHWTQQGVKLD